MGTIQTFIKSLTLSALSIAILSMPAAAEIAVSANDGKVMLKDGTIEARPDPVPDSADLFDLSGKTPKRLGSVEVPVSVIGPPQSVAITPDGAYALIASSVRIDPQNPEKLILDDRLSVVNLTTMTVAQRLRAGAGAYAIAVNRKGTLALVCNHGEDTLSVFMLNDGQLTPAGKIYFDKGAGPTAVRFTPDGSKALVTRDGDNRISLLTINGTKVIDPGYTIYGGLRPFSLTISRLGDVAYVSNIGLGGRDNGTISVIDLRSDPIRVINTLNVAPSPAGMAESHNGRYLAVSSLNGSHLTAGESGFHDSGLLQIFARYKHRFSPVAQIKTGHGCEGIGWNSAGNRLYLQCYGEKALQVYRFYGHSLHRETSLPLEAEPAGLAISPLRIPRYAGKSAGGKAG